MSGLTDAERNDLVDLIAEARDASPRLPNDADSWDVLDAIEPVIEQIVARHVTAALKSAETRIGEFDPSDDYHRDDVDTPGYYSAIFRAESLLRGEIAVWTDPKPPEVVRRPQPRGSGE